MSHVSLHLPLLIVFSVLLVIGLPSQGQGKCLDFLEELGDSCLVLPKSLLILLMEPGYLCFFLCDSQLKNLVTEATPS